MPNTVQYYLSQGFDKPTAEYFASGRKKIIAVEPSPNFTLLLTFENGEKRILDIKPILEKGGVFASFRNYENFKRVYLDECNDVSWDIDPSIDSNIVWENKVDLCPDSCYVDSVPIEKWDPDFTKLTPKERKELEEAEQSGYISDNEIDWDNLDKIV